MNDLLKKNRLNLNDELDTIEKRKSFSPAIYNSYVINVPLLRKYLRGKLLDVGCGHMPYKELISSQIDTYDSLDIESRTKGVTYIGDVQNMGIINSAKYDSAICFEVLEHVPDPFKAVSEIARILKKNGVVILSVPHLSRLHEVPYDYYRYTEYGLRNILKKNNLKIIKIIPRGGLFVFLGHQFSNLFVSLFWHIHIIKHIVFFLNKWLVVFPCYYLDKLIDKNKLFAAGYTCVAIKN